MSDEDKKRIVIVGGIIIIAAIILMLMGKNSATVVQRGGAIPSTANSFGDVIVNRQPFTIPDLGVIRGSDSLSAIGACCADCRPSNAPKSYTSFPSTTIVFNEGDKGPNIFNYYTPTPTRFTGTIITSGAR